MGGLTNGVNYSFTVTATNTGPFTSGPSNTLFATPTAAPTAPGAPSLASAVRADSQVTLTWQAPASNGGSPITGYTATASPGGRTCTTTGALFCPITGLTNGVNYSFTVTATNAVGTGAPSNSLSATPATAPSAPVLLTAVPGINQVTLTWSTPTTNGGLPITGYTATASPGGTTCTTTGALTCTVTGLAAGANYAFTVTATNSGPYISIPSNTLFATPTAGGASPPGPPTLVSATPGDSVALSWTAPTSDGGSPVTGYAIYRNNPGAAEKRVTVGNVLEYTDETTAYEVTYTYEVAAINAMGEGSRSAPLSATPHAPDTTLPSKPSSVKALVSGTTQVALDWAASTDNVGVVGYRVFRNGVPVPATITASNFLDSGLASGSSFTYQVAALDAAGNQSLLSTSVTGRTVALGTGTTGTLSGVIYNKAGAVLTNAVITVTLLNGTLKTVKPGAGGVWKLSNLPVGFYPITVSAAGYQSQSLTMTAVQGQTRLMTAAL